MGALLPRIYRIRTTGLSGDGAVMMRGWTLCLEWLGGSIEISLMRRESG